MNLLWMNSSLFLTGSVNLCFKEFYYREQHGIGIPKFIIWVTAL